MVYLKRTLTGPACFFRSVSGVIPASSEATLESANGPEFVGPEVARKTLILMCINVLPSIGPAVVAPSNLAQDPDLDRTRLASAAAVAASTGVAIAIGFCS